MVNLLIIGAGSAGAMVANELRHRSIAIKKYNLIGFLDDDLNKKNVAELPVLGTIENASSIIKEYKVIEVIIAIPSANRSSINKILDYLKDTNVKIKIVPGIYEIIEGNVNLTQIRDIAPEDLLGREEVGFDFEKIIPYYKDKTIFITGAGGSIGSEILFQLLKLPVKKIIAFGHGENSIFNLINKIEETDKFNFVIGDIKDYFKINHELKRFKPDIFFHAAAHKHVPLMEEYPDEAVKNNIIGTYNCAKASIENKVKRFILISSDKAVNPSSIMGATKRIAEQIILTLDKIQNGTNFSLVRFGNVLSSRGSVVHTFNEQIKKGNPITITHPEMTRFFMSIPEASRLVIKAGSIRNGKIFVLEMGKPIKILELAKNLIRLYGVEEDKIPIIFTQPREGEKLYEELSSKDENLIKSEYEKLLILNENYLTLDENKLLTMINEFKETAESYDKATIKKLLNKYIEEYKAG